MVSMFGETPRTVTALQAAEGALRDVCGWHVAPVLTETLTVDGNGRSKLKLPTQHIRAVTEVRVDGRDVTSNVRWSEIGMLEGLTFPRKFRSVEVDLVHGYEPAEIDGLLAIVTAASKRAETNPAIASQSVAGASVRYWGSDQGGPLSHLLTLTEREAIAPYMLTRGP